MQLNAKKCHTKEESVTVDVGVRVMTLLRLRVDEVHQGEQRPHAVEHRERVFRNRRAGEKVEICAIGEEKRTDISGDIRQSGRDSLFIIGARCKLRDRFSQIIIRNVRSGYRGSRVSVMH